jgi:hypothetical protein
MPQRKINLNHLPLWQQYLIALIVVSIVVAAALYFGSDDPVPSWINNCLIPGLGWAGLVLIILAIGDWIRKWRKPPKE